ncbi:MAG: hypothetical protein AAF391_05395 [Bacteroidota bacterium]
MAAINLQKIISVKGQPGLFNLINYNPKGYFLQSFEGGPIRFFSNEKGKVLAIGNVDLKLENNQSMNLLDVFRVIEKEGEPHPNISGDHLQAYFHRIIPKLDRSVALSHLQKVVGWYGKIGELFKEIEMINEEVDGLTII